MWSRCDWLTGPALLPHGPTLQALDGKRGEEEGEIRSTEGGGGER